MAMFGYFQNGFAQETDKPEKPKAESKPKAAAVKAAVKPVPRQRAALRPKRAGLLQSLFGRGKNKENPNHEKLCSDRKLCL